MTTPSGNARSARDVVIWIILAICAGVWLGIAARIAMRLIALEAGMAAGFSSGGSLEVILFGAMIGMPIALVVGPVARDGGFHFVPGRLPVSRFS